MNKVLELLKTRDYVVPSYLISNYKKLNLTGEEVIFLIYIINLKDNSFDVSKIEKDLNINQKEIFDYITSLKEKGIISLETIKINNKLSEVIIIEELYAKLSFAILEKEEDNTNIYSVFEKEFGRPLSPVEYEIIHSWLDQAFSEEIILEALKEAVYNNAINVKYIDTILFSWKKRGITKKEHIQEKVEKEIPKIEDYNWLDE